MYAAPYSLDLRTRVVAATADQTQEAVAARFAVSESTVYKWCQHARETGSPAAKPHCRRDKVLGQLSQNKFWDSDSAGTQMTLRDFE